MTFALLVMYVVLFLLNKQRERKAVPEAVLIIGQHNHVGLSFYFFYFFDKF